MKLRYLIPLLFASALWGQSTTVSTTGVVDTDTFAWSGGTYSITFVPNPNFPGIGQYVWSGGNLQNNLLFSGVLNGSGAFSQSLPSNTAITPSGSKWKFTICPNATTGCFSANIVATGSTQDVTATLNALAQGPRFAANPTAFGYGTVEVSPIPLPGAFFFNTTNNGCYQYSSSGWVLCGATGGGGPATFTALSSTSLIDASDPKWGAGCANAYDWTGALDSTCAIKNAVAAAEALIPASCSTNCTVPTIYFPGAPTTSSVIRGSCDVNYEGAGISGTIITSNATSGASANIFTITGTSLAGGYLCQGKMQGMTLRAGQNHLFVADNLELLNSTGFTLRDIQIENGGGRGINIVGNTERIKAYNVSINATRFPLVTAGDSAVFEGLNIASPGTAGDGYCYATDCINGVFPALLWQNAQVLDSAVGSGSTITYVVTGGSNGPTNNGISPIIAGQHFQVAGATSYACVNGTFVVASVANNTPSAGEFTVTATQYINTSAKLTPVSCTGTASVGSATWSPTILTTLTPAVLVSGSSPIFNGGEIKNAIWSAGFQFPGGSGGYINGFYMENCNCGSNLPGVNPGLEAPGVPPFTTLTQTLPATTAATTATVASTQWFWTYVNDPADASSVSGPFGMRILPCDYDITSSAQSGCAPSGVHKNMYENVVAIGTSAGVSILTRNGAGSTAPSGTPWPSGSYIANVVKVNAPLIPIVYENIHEVMIRPPGTGWAEASIDQTPLVVGEYLVGNIPNGLTSFTNGQNATYSYIGGQQANLVIQGGEGNSSGPNPSESLGVGFVKYEGLGGAVQNSGNIFPGGNSSAQDSDITNGNLVNQNQPPLIANPIAPDSSYSQMQFQNLDDGTNVVAGLNANNGNPEFSKPLNYYDSIAGQIYGSQFANTFCTYDTPSTPFASSGYFSGRFCLTGGPNNAYSVHLDQYSSGWNQNLTFLATGQASSVLSFDAPLHGGTGGNGAGMMCLLGWSNNGSSTCATNDGQIDIYGYNYSTIANAGGSLYVQGSNGYGSVFDSANYSGHLGDVGLGGFSRGAAINLPTNFSVAMAYGTCFGYVSNSNTCTYYWDLAGNINAKGISATSLNLLSTTSPLLFAGSAGTSGQCPISGGAGVTPSWGACGAGGGAWSAITNPTGNLALTMGSYTSLFTYGATTGSGDLFGLTDTASNTGTGILFHPHTASGSTEIPFQADANGCGWKVDATGKLVAVCTTLPTQTTMTYTGSHAPAGVSGAAVIAPDSSGNLDISENNGSFVRVMSSLAKGTLVCTSGGSITVTTAAGSSTSDILFTTNTHGGTQSWAPNVTAPPNGTQFVVVCATSDTSTYNYNILP